MKHLFTYVNETPVPGLILDTAELHHNTVALFFSKAVDNTGSSNIIPCTHQAKCIHNQYLFYDV
jgi:hypothetical protein